MTEGTSVPLLLAQCGLIEGPQSTVVGEQLIHSIFCKIEITNLMSVTVYERWVIPPGKDIKIPTQDKVLKKNLVVPWGKIEQVFSTIFMVTFNVKKFFNKVFAHQ